MSDPGAVLVIVVLAALQPLGPAPDGYIHRTLDAPTARVTQYQSLAACEGAAELLEDGVEENPLKGRTVRVFCVVP